MITGSLARAVKFEIFPLMPYLSNCSQVRRNVTDVAYHIAQYTNIISELREEIMVLRSKIQDQGPRSHANIQAVQCKDFNLSLT